MALWDKLQQELDRAGKAAQGALDVGRVRLDAFRARQLADKAAQALGYAVYRARAQGQELEADSYARLSSAIAGHEAEVTRLEAQLDELSGRQSAAGRGGASGASSHASARRSDPGAPGPSEPAAPAPPATDSTTPPDDPPHQPL